MNFPPSKWPHFYRVYLVTVCKQSLMYVRKSFLEMKLIFNCRIRRAVLEVGFCPFQNLHCGIQSRFPKKWALGAKNVQFLPLTMAGFGKFCPKTEAWIFALGTLFSFFFWKFWLPRLKKLWIVYQVSKFLKLTQNCTCRG